MLTVNGVQASVNDLEIVKIGKGTQIVRFQLLKDLGYGSEFPCYEYHFIIPTDFDNCPTDIVINNMGYVPVSIKVKGIEREFSRETLVKGLGI